jgi:hypothetical protein
MYDFRQFSLGFSLIPFFFFKLFVKYEVFMDFHIFRRVTFATFPFSAGPRRSAGTRRGMRCAHSINAVDVLIYPYEAKSF